MMKLPISIGTLLIGVPVFAGLPEDIAALAKPVQDATINRQVQDRVIAVGPNALIPLLQQWPNDAPVAANWLRTTIDDIAAKHPQQLPLNELNAFVRNAQAAPKARRVALRLIEQAQPGSTAKIIAGLIDDAEFSADAVADLINAAEESKDPATTKTLLQKAYQAASSLDQVTLLAKKLAQLDEQVNTTSKLGLITRWHVVGPFPVSPAEGLKQSFPPEKKIDFAQKFPAKAGEITWKPATTEADGKLDLLKNGVTPDQGSVAYATATFQIPKATKAEIRIGVVDNLTVWIDGKEVIKHASEYRSLFRADRYRAEVTLPAGEHVILIKFTKTPAEESGRPGAPPKWDAQIRLVQPNQQGLLMTQAGDKR